MARRRWSLTLAVCVATLAAPFVLHAPASGPGPAQVARPADPAADAGCGPASAEPVPDGRPITVTLPPAAAFTVGAVPAGAWRDPPVADPTWQLDFRGLTWAKSLARRAATDGQRQSLDALVHQTSLFHRLNPDPKSHGYGWDEGTALRRLETENCTTTFRLS